MRMSLTEKVGKYEAEKYSVYTNFETHTKPLIENKRVSTSIDFPVVWQR